MDKRIIKWLFKCLTSWSEIFYYKLILENIETIERHNDGQKVLYTRNVFFGKYFLNVIIKLKSDGYSVIILFYLILVTVLRIVSRFSLFKSSQGGNWI